MKRTIFVITATCIFLGACFGISSLDAKKGGKKNVELKVTSAAFKDGDMMPSRYSMNGGNVSPQIAWNNVPDGMKSFALICDDPDAPSGDWVHWVVYCIPPSVSAIPERQPKIAHLPIGAKQGINDSSRLGYDGPAPPSGTHRYFFKVYALDTEPSLQPGATKPQLLKAMEGHILAKGQIIGKYSKR